MKQQITWQQFTELSFEQVANLQKLIDQRYHLVKDAEHWEEIKNHKYVTSEEEVFNIHTSYIGFLSKTNIGKMIEILEISLPTLHIDKRLKTGMMGSNRYDVFQQGAGTHYADNLCDALWEAVKEVLKG